VLPTLWIGGRAFDLGSFGGNVGYAYDINDAGKIVGFSNNANQVMRAFSWYRGRITALENLGGATTSHSVARGINSSSVIAGESAVPGGTSVRAVLWTNYAPRELENLGGSVSSAFRINDLGYSVGFSNLSDATQHAALWTPRGDIVDLGADAVALDINNGGRIVGLASTGPQPKPVKWYRGVRTVLPTLGGESGIVFGINEKDQAVGYSQTATGLERATIWFGDRPVQIDTLLDDDNNGVVIHAAYAINDKGQIAAIRRLRNNRVEPLVLTPRRCDGT
jgi:probable HAF family extracellular repeat protein